jgi:hypothetical protein
MFTGRPLEVVLAGILCLWFMTGMVLSSFFLPSEQLSEQRAIEIAVFVGPLLLYVLFPFWRPLIVLPALIREEIEELRKH